VVKRRLELTIRDLASAAPKKLMYTLPNSMQVEYPATSLGEYLIGVYKSLFNPSRQVRLVLEALAGKDVRYALEMFCDILLSHYMTDDYIFKSRYHGQEVVLPEWLIIRILMRTKYRFFSENHGYILNLFATNEDSVASNFLLLDILSLLARDRKKQGELGIEGYRNVASLYDELAECGYYKEDIEWGLLHLLDRHLIVADHQRTTDISEDDHLKIAASGHYHLNFLLKRSEYLSSVCIDTWLIDRESAQRIARNSEDIRRHAEQRLQAFNEALGIESQRYISANSKQPKFKQGYVFATDALSSEIARFESPRAAESDQDQSPDLFRDYDNTPGGTCDSDTGGANAR